MLPALTVIRLMLLEWRGVDLLVACEESRLDAVQFSDSTERRYRAAYRCIGKCARHLARAPELSPCSFANEWNLFDATPDSNGLIEDMKAMSLGLIAHKPLIIRSLSTTISHICCLSLLSVICRHSH